jgi:hypothetical protein
MAFVKVVEGSEIYNFPIHTLVHFYFKIGRKSRSNKGTVKQFAAGTRRRAGRGDSKATRVPCTPRAASLFPGRRVLPVLPAEHAASPRPHIAFRLILRVPHGRVASRAPTAG